MSDQICSLCQAGPQLPDSNWCRWCHEIETAWPRNNEYWETTE